MTRIRFACVVVLLLGALASGSAAAHGVRFGFAFGFPVYPPAWYYPPPAYYYPPPVVAAPPVYVERTEAASPPPAEPYWYYCPDSRTYYPYVKDCRSPWQRVPARPPNS
jgi:hypothetical protein